MVCLMTIIIRTSVDDLASLTGAMQEWGLPIESWPVPGLPALAQLISPLIRRFHPRPANRQTERTGFSVNKWRHNARDKITGDYMGAEANPQRGSYWEDVGWEAEHVHFHRKIQQHGTDLTKLVMLNKKADAFRQAWANHSDGYLATFNTSVELPEASLRWEDLVENFYRVAQREPEIIHQVNQHHHFSPVGEVSSMMGFLHMRVPLNFSHIAHHSLLVCRCYDQLIQDIEPLRNSSLAGYLQAKRGIASLHFDCQQAMRDVMDIMQMFRIVPEDGLDEEHNFKRFYEQHKGKVVNRDKEEARPKRQLIGLIAATVVGALASNVGNLNLAHLFSGSSDNVNAEVVHDLGENASDLKILVSHDKMMDKVVKSIALNTSILEDELHHANLAHKIDACEIQSSVIREHLYRVKAGLRAVYKHELPFEFLNLHTYESNLPDLKIALANRGLRLVLDRPGDLYKLKTSWAMVKGTIYVLVHVPISPVRALPLYKFVGTPFYSKRLQDFYVYELEEEYLAIEHLKTGSYRAFRDLHDCTEPHDGLHICPGHNIIMTNHTTSCLMAIFDGNHEVATNLCRIRRFPNEVAGYLLAPNTFIFFTNRDVKGHFECRLPKGTTKDIISNEVLKQVIKKGNTLIRVPNHCAFKSSGLIMNAESISVSGQLLSKQVGPEFIDAMSLAHVNSTKEKIKLAREHLDDVFPDLDIPVRDFDASRYKWKAREEGWIDRWLHELITAGLIAVVVLCILLMLYCYCRARSSSGTSTNIVIGQGQDGNVPRVRPRNIGTSARVEEEIPMDVYANADE